MRVRGQLSPDMKDYISLGSSHKGKVLRDPQQGTIQSMFEKGDQRKQGTELIARQIEIENMKAMQLRNKKLQDE